MLDDTQHIKLLRYRVRIAIFELLIAVVALIFLLMFVTKAQITIVNKGEELKQCQEELSILNSFLDSSEGGGSETKHLKLEGGKP